MTLIVTNQFISHLVRCLPYQQCTYSEQLSSSNTSFPCTQHRVTVPRADSALSPWQQSPEPSPACPSSLTFLSPTNSFSAAVRLLISSSYLRQKRGTHLDSDISEVKKKKMRLSRTYTESPLLTQRQDLCSEISHTQFNAILNFLIIFNKSHAFSLCTEPQKVYSQFCLEAFQSSGYFLTLLPLSLSGRLRYGQSGLGEAPRNQTTSLADRHHKAHCG